jgi:hypothetical protein
MLTKQRINREPVGNEEVVFTSSTPGFDPVTVIAAIQSHTTLFEEMTPNSDGDRRQWKPFEHYKCQTQPSSGLSSLYLHDTGYPYYTATVRDQYTAATTGYSGGFGNPVGSSYGTDPGMPFAGLPELYKKRVDGGFIPEPANLSSLKQRALRTMLPGIKAELSVINSLIELKDFKSLPRTLSSIGRLLSGVFAKREAPMRQIVRGAADGYLQAQFNVMPLLSDIAGIYAAISRTEARVNDLLSRAGRLQRRHFTYSWTEFTPTDEVDSQDWLIERPWVVPNLERLYNSRRTTSLPSVFHAMIEYNFNFTQYQIEHARVLALLDAFGFNLNPAIIWNAIPWSFLVDWVISVSRWLDQFKIDNMKPQINILRYLWSIRRERLTYLSKETRSQTSPFTRVTGRVTLPIIRETAYRRSVGDLDEGSVLLSGLTRQEFSLGAALVLSRKRRRH